MSHPVSLCSLSFWQKVQPILVMQIAFGKSSVPRIAACSFISMICCRCAAAQSSPVTVQESRLAQSTASWDQLQLRSASCSANDSSRGLGTAMGLCHPGHFRQHCSGSLCRNMGSKAPRSNARHAISGRAKHGLTSSADKLEHFQHAVAKLPPAQHCIADFQVRYRSLATYLPSCQGF